MPIVACPFSVIRSLLPALLLAVLPAQAPASVPAGEPAHQDPQPAVVTQQEQNQLRATAFKAENEGSYGAAADAFLKLSQSAPNRIDWVVAAGRCLGRTGRFREAIDLLDAGRKRFDGELDIEAMLARSAVLQALPAQECQAAAGAPAAQGCA